MSTGPCNENDRQPWGLWPPASPPKSSVDSCCLCLGLLVDHHVVWYMQARSLAARLPTLLPSVDSSGLCAIPPELCPSCPHPFLPRVSECGPGSPCLPACLSMTAASLGHAACYMYHVFREVWLETGRQLLGCLLCIMPASGRPPCIMPYRGRAAWNGYGCRNILTHIHLNVAGRVSRSGIP